ncbi:SigB/SigF/SigG family RNA polymerase sigma factor [Nonomuraea sp. KC401]|uniref:SigB/SigF/SigG family RNA polymerase sigma factor n=1 Tax=Nonomuraea longispora TaxID=1848320 RepID=A0A4R4N1K5_9ACTN|nr:MULTISPECIES: SigB/SigF/SigG family RNA polymerase sigma factor [Nonomuraea]NBE98961.1 SigB/SigF/SigG family RNA polymerase sigma factor [Nonomuraea sp. K271]TDC00933.1 SigB/SigF/SigG family RNA polymerase sigma factor [Nonomuraea longispora]TLF57924.1 SigB/SigF/SigG family RNA polymerase sigma factor [Nonomuraea sp. KC401]
MAVQEYILEEMSAEELLAEMVKESTSGTHRERLRERIVEMHRPLAMEIARRYRYRGEPLEDLLQAAYVGLMKAVNGFDPSLGHAFRGYAVVTMTGEVKRHFRDRTWAIRVPRLYQERRSELNRLVADLSQDLGRSPTVAELAAKMNITEEDVLLTLDASAAYSTLSLDAPLGTDDDAASLGDVIPEDDDTLSTMVDREAVKPLIDALPSREKHILLLRFFGNMTQAEIAAEFGISQMHVSRILRKVLDQLRAELVG